ncbi:BZ3501_MvSof-1269-A2-R1_C40g00184 [Microbotryum saponariae]|nr:BZ3501_MvSof-1269-A2-R1_C40g00184 [Microbotryum saponariae]
MFAPQSNSSPFRNNSFGAFGNTTSGANNTSSPGGTSFNPASTSTTNQNPSWGASSSFYSTQPNQQQAQQGQGQVFGNSQAYSSWNQPAQSSYNHHTNVASPATGGLSNQGTPLGSQPPRKNYLPGYLSGVPLWDHGDSPSFNHQDNSRVGTSAWDSPMPSASESSINRRSSLSGSPGSRFGASQSLFGISSQRDAFTARQLPYGRNSHLSSQNAMDDDAPPISSLNEFTSDNNTLPSSLTSATNASSSPFSPTHTPLAPAPSSHTTNSPGYPVHIFGFPSTSTETVLSYFSQFGSVESYKTSEEGGNWLTLIYSEPSSALRASRKNGVVLGRVLMVGVKVVDEDELRKAIALVSGTNSFGNGVGEGEREGALTTTSTNTITGAGSNLQAMGKANGLNAVGAGSSSSRPVNVRGPQQAFKATPKKSFLSSAAQVAASSGTPASKGEGGDGYANLFEDKQRIAQRNATGVVGAGTGNAGGKGVLGKVSDAIFGW